MAFCEGDVRGSCGGAGGGRGALEGRFGAGDFNISGRGRAASGKLRRSFALPSLYLHSEGGKKAKQGWDFYVTGAKVVRRLAEKMAKSLFLSLGF